MYLADAELDDIQWVLRHSDHKTLHSYVQELPATMIRSNIGAQAWAKIRRFSEALDAAVAERVRGA